MKDYILLLPIIFIFHDMEEIIGFGRFFKKNPDLFERFPKVTPPYRNFNGITTQYGAHFILRIDKMLMKPKYYDNIINGVKSRLWAFCNFEGVEAIDGKWENLLSVLIAPLIELQVGYDMAYDLDQDKDAQYKTMVLFGLTWRWF